MCSVKGCKTLANGEIVTTFDVDEISIRLCKEHYEKYLHNENESHGHQWISYMSLAGCLCIMGLCSQSNLL